MRPFRIPKAINLPGWSIRVKLVDQAEIDAKTGEVDAADAWFDYNDDFGEILINKKLSKKHQRGALLHELQHAAVDCLDVALRQDVAIHSPKKKAG